MGATMRIAVYGIDNLYRILRRVVRYISAFIYAFNSYKAPPITDPILQTSATELGRLIREGQLKSEAILCAFIARIQEVEPFINATVECRFKEALEEAKQADDFVASGIMTKEQLEKEKPLLGVPVSVKVILTVKGLLCTAGSYLFKDLRAEEDATSVSLMRKAGAIVLVTTNCPEIGSNIQTSNNIHGTTCNPYNTSRTSGGSSGGESALISAAGSVIGIGNDLGGSIRIPCMFTGIFGHKPSRGLVSNDGFYPPRTEKMDNLLVTGPMCRYAEDLITMMKILSNPQENNAKFGEMVDFKNIKVYYLLSFGDNIPLTDSVDPEIKDAVIKVVSYLQEKKGSKVQEAVLPKLKWSFIVLLYNAILSIPDIPKFLTAGKAKVNGILEFLKYLFLQSKFTFMYIFALNVHRLPLLHHPKMIDFCKKMESKIGNEIDSLLDDKSILIMPTFPSPAPYHHEATLCVTNAGYTAIFNVLGMPSTQCPVGFNRQKLPIGVQIISKAGNDYLTLACAQEIEKAFGGWKPPT